MDGVVYWYERAAAVRRERGGWGSRNAREGGREVCCQHCNSEERPA